MLAGFSNLESEYPSEYRSNQRVLFYSKELANQLYQRILPFLETKDVLRAHPLDFGSEGTWVRKSKKSNFNFYFQNFDWQKKNKR